MKKMFLGLSLVLLSVMFVCGSAYAAVTGTCGNCHTMHNSQDGSPVEVGYDGSETGPYGNLTKSSCLGCHSGKLNDTGFEIPNIFGTYGTDSTAGGSFDTLNSADVDSYGHNVSDIAPYVTTGAEGTITSVPGNSGAPITFSDPNELTCAGSKGCHGNHDVDGSDAGIKGFHHGSYTGYRFLRYYDGTTHTDIKSKGSSDWEKGGATATNHNVYYASDTTTSDNTISKLCGMCHAEFHGDGNTWTGTVWKRHPTEELIPSDWNSVGSGVTVDYDRNPFGFGGTSDADYNAVTTTAAYSMSNNPRVACVSCHRAHATDQPDILRFDYVNDMLAGGGNDYGCLGCHTKQR